MKIQLYCVGCSYATPEIESTEEAFTPPTSCHCGAIAPIFIRSDSHLIAPTPLQESMLRHVPPPHLENFLGYSEYKSPAKDMLTEELSRLGSYSQSRCLRSRCREDYRQGREKWIQHLEEQKELKLEEQARQIRILEIGEP